VGAEVCRIRYAKAYGGVCLVNSRYQFDYRKEELNG